MKKLQLDIETIVLPQFEIGTINTIEWGEWTLPENNVLFAGVRINEEWHVIAENTKGLFAGGNDVSWLSQLILLFHPKEIAKLPFVPQHAIKSKKPFESFQWFSKGSAS